MTACSHSYFRISPRISCRLTLRKTDVMQSSQANPFAPPEPRSGPGRPRTIVSFLILLLTVSCVLNVVPAVDFFIAWYAGGVSLSLQECQPTAVPCILYLFGYPLFALTAALLAPLASFSRNMAGQWLFYITSLCLLALSIPIAIESFPLLFWPLPDDPLLSMRQTAAANHGKFAIARVLCLPPLSLLIAMHSREKRIQ